MPDLHLEFRQNKGIYQANPLVPNNEMLVLLVILKKFLP